MNAIKRFFREVKPIEYVIFFGSVVAIVLSFALTIGGDLPVYLQCLQLVASLIGACALILIAKGNVLGQIISVVFSIFYGVISYFCKYYGEIVTYLGMSAPIAVLAVVSWLKHPFQGKRSEVTVNHLKGWEYPAIFGISIAVSVPFFFILRALGTDEIWWSTVSVLTSCIAMLLSVRRSPLYAFAYCLNDTVLIVLWSLKSAKEISYISMVVCFAVFLVNDIYGLINWIRLHRKQQETLKEKQEDQ